VCTSLWLSRFHVCLYAGCAFPCCCYVGPTLLWFCGCYSTSFVAVRVCYWMLGRLPLVCLPCQTAFHVSSRTTPFAHKVCTASCQQAAAACYSLCSYGPTARLAHVRYMFHRHLFGMHGSAVRSAMWMWVQYPYCYCLPRGMLRNCLVLASAPLQARYSCDAGWPLPQCHWLAMTCLHHLQDVCSIASHAFPIMCGVLLRRNVWSVM
jgi:hypothetical protein